MAGLQQIARKEQALPFRNKLSLLLKSLSDDRFLYSGDNLTRQVIKLMFLAQFTNLIADDSEYVPDYFTSDPLVSSYLGKFASRYAWTFSDIQFGWVEHLDISDSHDQFVASVLNAYTNFGGYRFGTMSDLIDGRVPVSSDARFTINVEKVLDAIRQLSSNMYRQPFIRSFHDQAYLIRESSNLTLEVVDSAESREDEKAIHAMIKSTQERHLEGFLEYMNRDFDADIDTLDVSGTAAKLTFNEYQQRSSGSFNKLMIACALVGMLFTSIPEHYLADKLPIFNDEEYSLGEFAADSLARLVSATSLCILGAASYYIYNKFKYNQYMEAPPVSMPISTSATPVHDGYHKLDGDEVKAEPVEPPV